MTPAGFFACAFVTMAVIDGRKHWHKGKRCAAFPLLVGINLFCAFVLFAVDLSV